MADDFDWDKEWRILNAKQQLELLAMNNKYGSDIAAAEKQKNDTIEKYGGIDQARLAALVLYNETQEKLNAKLTADLEAAFYRHHEEQANIGETPKQDSPSQKTEPVDEIKAEELIEPELTDSYKQTVVKLKQEREAFFKEHFDEMGAIARNPNIPEAEIKYFLERDAHQLSTMAQSHYKQLINHRDNPYLKQTLADLAQEKEKRLELERVQKQKEEEKKQQERQREQESWDKLLQQYEQTKQEISQQNGHSY